MRGGPGAALLLAVLLAGGCRSSAAAVDAGDAAVVPDGGAASVPALPAMRDWTCPAGWQPRRVGQTTEVEHAICVPPVQLACPIGQAQFLGEPGCRSIGTACPAGDFLDEPALRGLAPGFDGKVLYVRPAGTGTGSRSAPVGSIAQALGLARAGDLVALARGTYLEPVTISQRVALVGACVEATAIAPTSLGEATGIVQLQGSGGELLANLRLSGPSVGVKVLAREQPVSLRAVEVSGARVAGLFVFSSAAGADIEDLVVRDTGSSAKGEHGTGAILNGGKVSLRRGLFERNRSIGLGVGGQAAAELSDLVVRDTESQERTRTLGTGFHAEGGVTVVRRALFERNREAAVSAANAGTRLDLVDVVARDTRSEESNLDHGFGLEVVAGAAVSVERGLFERNRRTGVSVTRNPGTAAPSLVLVDVVIRETLPIEKQGGAGMGLAVYSGATATVTRTLLEANRHLGVYIGAMLEGQRPRATLSDVAILDTASSEHKLFGRGLEIEDGAPVEASRLLLGGNREAGLTVGTTDDGKPGTYRFRDLVVRDTHPAACVELPSGDPDRCVEGEVSLGGGTGVVVIDRAEVELRSFEVARSAQCGLMVARQGRLGARDGSVHHNAVGLNLQDEGYDPAGIIGDTVRFFENDTNLSSARLPLPSW